MTLRITLFALLLSLGVAACGGTVDTSSPAEESADAGSSAADGTDVEPAADAGDGDSDTVPACNHFVPRGPSSPTGCCPTGCAPLDPPEAGVYCVHQGTGNAC